MTDKFTVYTSTGLAIDLDDTEALRAAGFTLDGCEHCGRRECGCVVVSDGTRYAPPMRICAKSFTATIGQALCTREPGHDPPCAMVMAAGRVESIGIVHDGIGTVEIGEIEVFKKHSPRPCTHCGHTLDGTCCTPQVCPMCGMPCTPAAPLGQAPTE